MSVDPVVGNRLRGGTEMHLGIGGRTQLIVFLILISILVLTLEVFLIVSLRGSRPPYQLSMWFYSLPVFHLLPWAVGIQALGKIRKALSTGSISTSGAQLASGVVVSLLIATYIVLGSAETMGMLAYRLAALHCNGSVP
jgi:hypothetical protein